MALTKTFLGYFSFGSFLFFVYCILTFINPFLLKYVLLLSPTLLNLELSQLVLLIDIVGFHVFRLRKI
jgi:hypothetical protein